MRQRVPYFALVVPGLAAIFVLLTTNPLGGFPWSMSSVASFVVGGVIAWKVPGNPISWLLLLFGSLGIVGFLLWELATQVDSPELVAWSDAVFNSVNTASVLVFPIILLRFPGGSIPSTRWRIVEWMAIAAAGVGFIAALFNGGWGGDLSQAVAPSPLYEATRPIGDILSGVFFTLFVVGFVVAASSLLIRYRTSVGEERLQLRWLAFAGVFVILAISAVLASSGFAEIATDSLWEQSLMALAFTAIPLGIGVAVLKYRLYDIDVVIGRTLVLAILAGFITITYALIVVGIGRLIGGDSGGLLLPISATALVAVAFEPVRHRAQRWANRLVYGERASPYEVLSDLTVRLSAAEEPRGILDRLSSLVQEGTGAHSVAVWLGPVGSMTIAASSPPGWSHDRQPSLDTDSVFEVKHGDETVGALQVMKGKGSSLSTAERSLIRDVAGSTGAVLGYERLNESLEQRATDLAASRSRLLDVQAQERKRLERDLHEGAEQFIVALKVKIGVASQMAGRARAHDLESLLSELSDEAQAALDDVQSLAKGIYPPVLESDGLGAALAALASSSPVDVLVERDGVARYRPEIEAAVYFDISEAVTNAVKHAMPPIRIRLSERDGVLSFSVVDDGPGFDLDRSEMGSGLENMADRLEAVGGHLTVKSTRGQRTEVLGEIPVGS